MTPEAISNSKDIRLRAERCGGGVLIDAAGEKVTLWFYTKSPSTTDLCHLSEGVIIRCRSDVLRSLCEMYDYNNWNAVSWTCKKRDCRLDAKCSYAGQGAKSRGEGFKFRATKKVDCSARVTSVSLKTFFKQDILDVISSTILPVFNEFTGEDHCIEDLSVINSVNINHVNHDCRTSAPSKRHVLKSSDLLRDSNIKESLETFTRHMGRQRGASLKAWKFLSSIYPTIVFDADAVRQSVSKLRQDDKDALKLVQALQSRSKDGDLDYLHVKVGDQNILTEVIWSYKGSQELVERCGELLFWYSTHNMTPYTFKLASFVIVDSEGKSRSVFFRLGLTETVEDCSNLISHWHKAFNMKLPKVIFSDGDEGISGSLLSLDYEVRHLLCTFHIFDLNVKSKVLPVLSATSGASSWALFRQSLSTCQTATSEEIFQELWNYLISEWFPSSPVNDAARSYLQQNIWPKRHQWCVAFFSDTFTMGSSTTQRVESWNNLLKCFSDSSSLAFLEEAIFMLFQKQGDEERKSMSKSRRLVPLGKPGSFLYSFADLFSSIGLSKYASSELCTQL